MACDHKWEPGTQGRVFRCTVCGATAIRMPIAPVVSNRKKYIFLSVVAGVFLAAFLLSR